MSDLSDLVEAYKREVAPPGGFDVAFPGTSNDDIIGALADGFAQAQLAGFFSTSVVDLDDLSVTPDLSPAASQLVVIFAGLRTIRGRLLGLNTMRRYKSGPVEVEMQQGASVLTELLKDLRSRLDRLMEQAKVASRGQTTFAYDGYLSRVSEGFYDGEVPSVVGSP